MVDDGRTTEQGYTISSPCEPDGSGELKRCPFEKGKAMIREWHNQKENPTPKTKVRKIKFTVGF